MATELAALTHPALPWAALQLEWSASGAKLASCSLDKSCRVRTLCLAEGQEPQVTSLLVLQGE